MKKLLFLLTAAMVAMSVTAAPVDQATAMRKAKSYLTNELFAGKLMAPAAVTPVLLKAEMGNPKLNQPVYYIFNTDDHFIIISGDDRAKTVLAYGDRPINDINRMPANMKYWLGVYKKELEYLQDHPEIAAEQSLNAGGTKGVSVEPLLTALWDQQEPYYNHCSPHYGISRNHTTITVLCTMASYVSPAALLPRSQWYSIIGNSPLVLFPLSVATAIIATVSRLSLCLAQPLIGRI